MSRYNELSNEDIVKRLTSLSQENGSYTKNLYFAGPWFSEKAYKVYTALCSLLKTSTLYDIFIPRNFKVTENQNALDLFYKDVSAIIHSDVVLAWVDEKDMGTAFEIGYAVSKNIPVYLMGYDKTTFYDEKHKTNLMLASSAKGWITFDDLPKFLNGDFSVVKKVDFSEVE